MFNRFIALLIGSTALAPLNAMAQAPTAADCDRLVVVLEQHKVPNASITLTQARLYQKDKNIQACHDAMMRPEMAATDQATATQITLQQTAPTVKVDQGAPQVNVQQAQPDVTVSQSQPEITVHQPAPTVTVDIPQPEITVRMPKPMVNVSMAQPTVQVTQPKPTVQVMQQAQPQVQVEPAQAQVNVDKSAGQQANVTIQGDQQQPKIAYTSDQAKVVVNQAKTAPSIKMEPAGLEETDSAAGGTKLNATPVVPVVADKAPASPANDAADTKAVMASSIMRMNVLNAKGDTLGDVEHVLMSGKDHKAYIVIGHGGFLGLGEKQVALPLDSMFLRGNNLVMRGLTDDQIRAMPSWTRENHDYTDFTADQTAPISTSG